MVEAENFHKGAMRVKCVASLSPVLWKGDKESVLQRRRPGLIDNREAMLLGKKIVTTPLCVCMQYFFDLYLFVSTLRERGNCAHTDASGCLICYFAERYTFTELLISFFSWS